MKGIYRIVVEPAPEAQFTGGMDAVNMFAFSDRLRSVRQSRRLSQDQLAQMCGLQSTAISHFETGRRTPCGANLLKLTQALKTDANYLLGLSSKENLGFWLDA